MKKQFLLLYILALGLNVFAQKEVKVAADKAYDHLSYLKAADLYQQLGESGLDEVAKARLAESYRLNGDTELAEYWYAQSISENSSSIDILHYAQMLQSNNKCEVALEWYNKYLTLVGKDYPLPRANVKNCADLTFTPKEYVTVTNAKSLNSGHLDYSPVPYKGGVVFTSTRGGKTKNGIEDSWTKDNFSDLFFAKKVGTQSFNAVELLEGQINGDFHDGTATFNKQGTMMYFSRNDDDGKNKKEIVDLKIYSAELNSKKWGNVKELPFNNPEYSTCHPTLSADGNTLYFASNRPGGMGGMDIYKSIRSGSYWSVPENLGEKVNTAGNEIFPFVNKEGKLFFASNGWAGIGGLDIYQTSKMEDNWSTAENLGEPINSSKDDFGYSQLENGEEGYFTSNRSGGFGGDDIYYWSGNVPMENRVKNVITVIDEASGTKLKEAMVTVIEGVYQNKVNIPAGTQVKNGEIEEGQTQMQPITFLTDPTGKIQPDIRDGKTYTILVEKQGYRAVRKVVNAYELTRKPEWVVPLSKRLGIAVNGAVIHQEYNRTIPNASLTLFNFCTGEYENTTSDEEGNFEFFLDCNCDYEIVAKKERFEEDKKKYSTIGIDCESTKPITSILYLNVDNPKPVVETVKEPIVNVKPTPTPIETYEVGQVITLEDVLYDFNKATIRGDASAALDNLVNTLKQHPSMEIELYSHTDSRGNPFYNERLSQKRANSAVQYLINHGISSNRVSGKGYGEWLLKNHCADGVKCSETEHQKNRRTEVKIINLASDVKVEYRK